MPMRFIKLYDQILQWEWYKNPNTFRLFIHLLLRANYCEAKFEGRIVKRGQLVTSLPTLSAETGLSVREIRTALDHLKSTGELTDTSTSKYRVITITKYDDYQSSDRQIDRQATGDRQASDRPATASIESIESIEEDVKDNNNIFSLSDREVGDIVREDQQIEQAAMNIGLIVSPAAMDKARDLVFRYGLQNVLDAIGASVDVPKWSYVEGILRNEKKTEKEARLESEIAYNEHKELMKQAFIKMGDWDDEYQCQKEKAEKYRQRGLSPKEAQEEMESEREKRIRQYDEFVRGRKMG